MRKLWWVLLFIAVFSACAQTPPGNDTTGQKPVLMPSRSSSKRAYYYGVDAVSGVIGFSIMVNGVEVMAAEGGSSVEAKIDFNDWMVSGNNKIDINVFWPDNVKFSPEVGSGSFRIFSNDKSIKEFKWPLAPPDRINSYPHTFTEIIKADNFPKVLLEKAERVISSAGTLPRADQNAIAEIAQQLRKAFTEKDIETIDSLFNTKYSDIAVARFMTPAAVKAGANEQFRDIMNKEGYAVFFNGRNSYFSAADDRAVRLGQGRIGFPEPALIITWKEGRTNRRLEMDLYFAKIDGKWLIIR